MKKKNHQIHIMVNDKLIRQEGVTIHEAKKLELSKNKILKPTFLE